MALSRLRLRLAGWFALAFIAGLLLLSLGLFAYTRHQGDRRFTRALELAADQLLGAVRLEYGEAPGRGLQGAVASALEEWVPRPEAFGIYDGGGTRVAVTGPTALTRALPPALALAPTLPADVPGPGEHPIRLAAASADAPAVTVLVAGSTERLDEDAEGLALWLVVSTPLTALLSLMAGYGSRAMPCARCSASRRPSARWPPTRSARRLPVHDRPDELDRVAQQFNTLLGRLEQSQERNRRFIEQAAHQIRTPLTLVLGETELALEGARSSDAQTDALRRVRLAAVQMRRRVEELMLLARAAAGDARHWWTSSSSTAWRSSAPISCAAGLRRSGAGWSSCGWTRSSCKAARRCCARRWSSCSRTRAATGARDPSCNSRSSPRARVR